MSLLVGFYSLSGNTARFCEQLTLPKGTLFNIADVDVATDEYVLIFPTYSMANGAGSVPKKVLSFLNHNSFNRMNLRGIIAAGDRSFCNTYCLGGKVLSDLTKTPILREIEIGGDSSDVAYVERLVSTWKS